MCVTAMNISRIWGMFSASIYVYAGFADLHVIQRIATTAYGVARMQSVDQRLFFSMHKERDYVHA